jgi:hypothetical protein
VFPRGWRVPLEYRRERTKKEVLVRLMGVQRKEAKDVLVDDGVPKPEPAPRPAPGKPPIPIPGKAPKAPGPSGPGAKLYQAKAGFANYYFNKLERDRLLAAFKKHGDFSDLAGNWTIDGAVRLKKLRTESKTRIEILDVKSEDGKGSKTVVKLNIEQFPYELEPLKATQDPIALKMPETSGGLLSALYLWQRLLTLGNKAFGEDLTHGGYEPFYPPPTDGKTASSLASLRVDAEVLNSRHGPFLAKWFFSQADHKLLGFEVRMQDNEDPCEVYFADYRPVAGRLLPQRMQVIYGDGHYGTFSLENYNLAGVK